MAQKVLENPAERVKRLEKSISFSDKYEEELKETLFAESEQETEVSEEYIVTDKFVHHERPGEEWDVPITEEIHYFDPELSYELTGYRPLTLEKGLDFDPELFREAAKTFESQGVYTKFPFGCKPFREYWNEQGKRCKHGLTIGKYRITGDNYYFLNFYRMMIIDENAVGGAGRAESFPGFVAKQYEFFHYLEMARILRKDVCTLKSRGVGWSEITACCAVRPYTTNRGYNIMLSAVDSAKLDPLRDKVWLQMDFLNENTGGGFTRYRQVFNSAYTRKASMKTKEGNEVGWGSMVNCVIADNPDKIRGPRYDFLVLEEAGSNAQLEEHLIKATALTSLGGRHIGCIAALGTGGQDMAVGGLATVFSHPDAYNVLPYKNYDTDDGKPELTAFFLPAHKFSLLKDYVDSRGVTNYPEFKKVYEEQRSKLSDKSYLNFCAEYCFTPREALSKHGDNVFDAVALGERMMQIKVQGLYTKPQKMQLLWDKTVGDGMSKVTAHVSPSSHLYVVEPPQLDERGQVYKNLYVAGIDAIDMGRNDSATDGDVSDFCVIIKKRAFGMEDPKYVAMYKFRPDDIRQAYDLTMKLLTWYNCKALLEYTKISIQTYFRDKGKANLFMSRPQFAITGPRKPNKRLVGVPATEAVIRHGLELVGNFVNDYWHTIDFEDIVDQLLNYSYANKRKFDIVAALQMCELADEDLSGVSPTVTNKSNSEWQDLGWFINDKGYKEYGVIPKRR